MTKKKKEEEENIGEKVTILDTDLEKLTNDAKDFKDKYLRLLAETENQRKRLAKERQDLMKFAKRDLVLELLNPIDHMENALGHSEQAADEIKHWAIGFKMILDQFKEVLSNHNVKPFDALGQVFDPHLHDAVETVETTDAEQDVVVEQLLRGYMMGDMTLRPARVKIAKAPQVKEEKQPVLGEENGREEEE